MAALLPVALFGLTVPPGNVLVPVAVDFPATIRITMAAIDPDEEPEPNEEGNIPSVPRATLKLVKQRIGPVDEDSDEDEDEYLQALLANGEDDDEDDEDSDDEPNGGPSDPAKSKKARQDAAIKKLLAATQEEDSDEDMDDAKVNGTKANKKKGKELATAEDDEEDDEDDDSEDDEDLDDLDEPFTLCTLDTERHFQQPLDITIGENERAFFIVSGTHTIHLTGNYVIGDDDDDEDDSEDEDDYDLPPDMDELVAGDDISSDELDELEDARVEELEEDEEEAPQLVPAKKGKKRPAEDEAEVEGLDEQIAKAGDAKLSKKQLKKLKNNKGEAVVAADAKATAKDAAVPAKADKKVQFAKNLEQGPTGSTEKAKQASDKPTLGVKVVQGVTIDDRKLGSGRTAKSGDKVSLRYIGKLTDGKVFDSNKKGSPFSFKIGKGEVIKGWDTGLVGLAVGGERRLTIPPSLAYGSKKLDGIPANSTLVFDVKLLSIN